jgi:diacylglycerol kinase
MNTKKQSSTSRIGSIRFATNGIQQFFRDEPNARLHLVATVGVFILAVYLHVSSVEWILLITAIGLVWITEILNTAIEHIMDFISTAHSSKIKTIKDTSAAAVLVAAGVASVTGLIVFIPKIV